jgi:hypothetical protein
MFTTERTPPKSSPWIAAALLLPLLAFAAGRPAAAQGDYAAGEPSAPPYAGDASYAGGDIGNGNGNAGYVADPGAADPAGPQANQGSYGYFRIIEGSATLIPAGNGEKATAQVNQPVMAGDRIRVADKGRVEIVLADRNLLRLDGGSEVVLAQLAGTPDADAPQTLLRLDEGNFQLVVMTDALGDQLPRIDTPNATIYVQNPGTYRVTSDQGDWTSVLVRRGSAEVVTPKGSFRVRADQEAHVEGTDSRADLAQASAYDAIERWGRDLEARVADNGALDPSLRYEGSALDQYGSWIDVGGQHYWRPTVDGGWRPFTDGYWTSTPSGLTWVATEPWGWVPYHYGSWDYLDDYGWAWQPGSVYSPAWVYWYWGPSEIGWCPVGYYTGWYGHRFHDPAFRHGVYGWAGGNREFFEHWNFIDNDHFGHRDLHRWVRPGGNIGDMRGDMRAHQLPRGIITTDTRGVTPNRWHHPDQVLNVLRAQGGRTDRLHGSGNLPDVTSFVARNPNLPPQVLHSVIADTPDKGRFSGTPLRPATQSGRPAAGSPAATTRGRWADRTPVQAGRGSTPATATTGVVPDRGDRGGRGDRFGRNLQPNPAGQPTAGLHTWDRRGTPASPAPTAPGTANRNREAWRELPATPRADRPGRSYPLTLTVTSPPADRQQNRQPDRLRNGWREIPTPVAPGGQQPDRGQRPDAARPRSTPPQGQAPQGQAPRTYAPPPQRYNPPPQAPRSYAPPPQHYNPPPAPHYNPPPPQRSEPQRPAERPAQKPPERHSR